MNVIFLLIILVVLLINIKSTFKSVFNHDIINGLYRKFKNRFENYNNKENLNGVDKVYCIVMPQRKEYMKKVLDKMGINYTLFNAITPLDLSKDNYDQLSLTNKKDSPLFGYPTRLALQLSFTMCYIDAINNNYDTIIVFEDDIVVNTDNNTLTNYINEFKKSNYVFFYMGYCWMNCNQKFDLNISKNLINVVNKTLFCCHAICYKVKYLKELIDFIYPMKNNLDNNVSDFIKNKNYDVCIPNKTLFDQNRNELETLNADDNIGNLPNCNNIFFN
jgi:GR25 family glycosyltransferase involved in LPS biosynthesis